MNNVCQNCKKARATVHLTEIDPENNEPHQMHLCDSCARQSGASKEPPKPVQQMTFTASLIGLHEKGSKSKTAGARVSCSECGMSYQEFRVKGRFGCLRCYEAFSDSLVPLLERVHGASQYVGRKPGALEERIHSSAALEQELLGLKRRLGSVVKEEKYEEAARIRDRIAELEQAIQESRDA